MTFDYKPDLVIYHSPCDDGFGAAWAVYTRFGTDGVEYFGTKYNRPAPDVKGKHVLIVDFSYPYDTLVALSFEAASITILDHHKTAKADLARLPMFHGTIDDLGQSFAMSWTQNTPPIAARFDMEKCGARLAWEFCWPNTPPPLLIQLIEDRDLWKFELELTKPFTTWLRSFEQTFENWDRIRFQLEDAAPDHILVEARAIERFYHLKVKEIAAQSMVQAIGGHVVPCVNTSEAFASDVCHELLKAHPDASFTAVFTVTEGGLRKFSLRSDDQREDVSAIAKRFGGGGHRNAAGFEAWPGEL